MLLPVPLPRLCPQNVTRGLLLVTRAPCTLPHPAWAASLTGLLLLFPLAPWAQPSSPTAPLGQRSEVCSPRACGVAAAGGDTETEMVNTWVLTRHCRGPRRPAGSLADANARLWALHGLQGLRHHRACCARMRTWSPASASEKKGPSQRSCFLRRLPAVGLELRSAFLAHLRLGQPSRSLEFGERNLKSLLCKSAPRRPAPCLARFPRGVV